MSVELISNRGRGRIIRSEDVLGVQDQFEWVGDWMLVFVTTALAPGILAWSIGALIAYKAQLQRESDYATPYGEMAAGVLLRFGPGLLFSILWMWSLIAAQDPPASAEAVIGTVLVVLACASVTFGIFVRQKIIRALW